MEAFNRIDCQPTPNDVQRKCVERILRIFQGTTLDLEKILEEISEHLRVDPHHILDATDQQIEAVVLDSLTEAYYMRISQYVLHVMNLIEEQTQEKIAPTPERLEAIAHV